MTPTTTTRPPEPDRPLPRRDDLLVERRAERGDRAFRTLALAAGLLVLVVLTLVAVSTTREAWPVFEAEGLGFVLQDDWAPSERRFGALAFIYGTVLVSLIALVLAVPVSLGIALFATEAAPKRYRRAVVYVLDLLAAIPSVVYGLWGVLVLAPALRPVFESVSGAVAGWPLLGTVFGEGSSGRSFLTAGIILAVMITPIITSLSREVIATVPAAQREAAYGMGATRWEMIRSAVLPWSRGGITGAVMLGLGRAMGETIAVALVIGSSAQITFDLFAPGDAMAAVIANQFGEAAGLHRSALIGLGVVLFVVTIAVNMAARAIVGRMDRRIQGS
jgi:phosphate transport system permease protein